MAIIKNLNSNYIVTTPLGTGSNITLSSDTVIIPGNLSVLGSTSAIETTNTTIKDNIIVLNDGENGAGVSAGTAGITVDRGTLTNVSIRWNETYTNWQITNNGATYTNIASSSTGLTAVIDDVSPTLGGNLNTNGWVITSSQGNIFLANNIAFVNTVTATPAAINGTTVVYAAIPGAGTSGVYVVNGSAVNQELITKARALGYSILF